MGVLNGLASMVDAVENMKSMMFPDLQLLSGCRCRDPLGNV